MDRFQSQAACCLVWLKGKERVVIGNGGRSTSGSSMAIRISITAVPPTCCQCWLFFVGA